jgi:hypothetical protein
MTSSTWVLTPTPNFADADQLRRGLAAHRVEPPADQTEVDKDDALMTGEAAVSRTASGDRLRLRALEEALAEIAAHVAQARDEDLLHDLALVDLLFSKRRFG